MLQYTKTSAALRLQPEPHYELPMTILKRFLLSLSRFSGPSSPASSTSEGKEKRKNPAADQRFERTRLHQPHVKLSCRLSAAGLPSCVTCQIHQQILFNADLKSPEMCHSSEFVVRGGQFSNWNKMGNTDVSAVWWGKASSLVLTPCLNGNWSSRLLSV